MAAIFTLIFIVCVVLAVINKLKHKKIKGYIIGAVVSLVIAVISDSGAGSNNDDVPTGAQQASSAETITTETKPPETKPTEAENVLTFGSAFEFNDLEITIGDSSGINFVTVENEFSDVNGADVVELPIKVKNLKEETHFLNEMYLKFFGIDGTQTRSVSVYFDNDNFTAGELRSGASYETFLHFIYNGDGDYYIEFDNMINSVEVKLPVVKP
jgi:hypothetical protein